MKKANRKKLTARVVAAAKPPESGKDHLWDTEVPGFALRVYASGHRSYMVKVALRGRQRWMTIGAHGETVYDVATDETIVLTPANARTIAAGWRALARAGIDPAKREQEHRDEQLTINDLADEFEKGLETAKESTQRAYRLQLVHVRDEFGKRRPDELTIDDVRSWHRKMADTPSMANRALDRLSALMNDAARRGLVERGTNPTRGVRRFKEESRERFLSSKELARLDAALDALAGQRGGISEDGADAIRLLLFTGCRVGEVLSLAWNDVDFERRSARLRQAKTGTRNVGLNQPAVDLLLGLRRRHPESDWVFPGGKPGAHLTTIDKGWYRVREKAGIADVRLHDLRHTVATWGASAGAPLRVVGKILGHRNESMTERYGHLFDDAVREASERIGAAIADALAKRPEGDDDDVMVQ